MTGVGQPDAPSARDAQRQTSGMRAGSSTKSLVQLLQHRQRIRIVVGCGTERTDDQGYQHSGLQAFAGNVAGDDQHAAVGGVRQDLKEVSAYLARRAVLAFNAESGMCGSACGIKTCCTAWAWSTSSAMACCRRCELRK